MRIDVAILEVGQGLHADISEMIESKTEDVFFDVPVTGELDVTRDRTTVRLQGKVESSTPLSCGRCLTPFRLPLRAYLNEEFLVDPRVSEAREKRELQDEDFVHALGPDLILDVNEVIRQHLLLGLPMIPLCRPDCRGLCPECGANWNETTCGHQGVARDPRLAPLTKLRDRFPKE